MLGTTSNAVDRDQPGHAGLRDTADQDEFCVETSATSFGKGIHSERTNRAPKRRSENDDSGWSIFNTPELSSESKETSNISGGDSHLRSAAIHGQRAKANFNGTSCTPFSIQIGSEGT